MRTLYRLLRSLVVTTVFTVVGLILLLYIAISLPIVQNLIKNQAEKELAFFLKSEVTIGEINFLPFNQAVIKDLVVYDLSGRKAVQVKRIGAGIALWRLLTKGEMIFTHAELMGLQAQIFQDRSGESLNIQFIIDAFKPKDPNKPPTKFDFCIRHIVIRNSAFTFNRIWKPEKKDNQFDINHIRVYDFAADISLPKIKNDDFTIDLKRLRLKEAAGLNLDKMACHVHVTPYLLDIKDLQINLPNSAIRLSDMSINSEAEKWQFVKALKTGRHRITIEDALFCPSDIRFFVKELDRFSEVFKINLDVIGNFSNLQIEKFTALSKNSSLSLNLKGNASGLNDRNNFAANIGLLELNIDGTETARIVGMLTRINPDAAQILKRIGHLTVKAEGKITQKSVDTKINLISGLGNLTAESYISTSAPSVIDLKASVETNSFDLGTLLNRTDIQKLAINGECDLHINARNVTGIVKATVPFIEYGTKRWENINIDAERSLEEINLALDIDDIDALLRLSGNGFIKEDKKGLSLMAEIDHVNLGALPFTTPLGNARIGANADINISGLNLLDFEGNVNLNDISIDLPGKNPFYINHIELESTTGDAGSRLLVLHSPYVNGVLQGHYAVTRIPDVMRNLLHKAFPSFIPPSPHSMPTDDYANLHLTIGNCDKITEYFNLPVRLLEDATVNGSFDNVAGIMNVSLDIPYMLQGKDKLIRDSRLTVKIDKRTEEYLLGAITTMPSKSNEVTLNIDVNALDDWASTSLGWKVHSDNKFGGLIKFDTHIGKNPMTSMLEIGSKVLPSTFFINDTSWQVAPAEIRYGSDHLEVHGLKVYSNDQYASIEGRASASLSDTLNVNLRDINLDYIFSTLGINFVTFGGNATGNLAATALFSKTPVAYTDSLFVKNMTYNGGLLGDGILRSHFDAINSRVAIRADIQDSPHSSAIVDGGIWIKKDSLSFSLDANKINIKFLQPFMQAFTSDVSGRASGKALLYGTFKDIDLKGRLFADTINMKIDFTNTYYSGSDSVIINPGNIDIQHFKLYDQFGHTALFNGWLNHNFFHDPIFEFNITNAKDLLCYDTDAAIDPIWYGKIYGNGGATIKGRPGIVNIMVDMSTAPKSVFTFVLSDSQEAINYNFLTFTDRKKAAAEAAVPDTTPPLLRKYRRMVQQQLDEPSAYVMDLRASVTPDAEMIIIMDPIAGDKIKSYGSGALQVGYSSIDERLTMYGRYTLDRGTYNFSLQDLILKTFNIRPGSTISFNGDPYSAMLDIDAIYKVNTNLTDLDPSFATDHELNRTNVPVEAVLKVKGDMKQPDITFDIEMPTLSEDVARKVRSIVSTEDMMSRQIIYLLALNRFYTPEYMGVQGNNNEFASIASTTLSSHLTNILGQIAPNWSFAPNLRTDQGDFSDLEVDLALSSRMFDNRLLLNGNLGYRDRTTSSTTFIGDFDIEYLLNRAGTLRLKAYNHFNDQNYYLRSALTTQGLGILYKHDFDHWFSFLRKRRKKKLIIPNTSVPSNATDTILQFK